MTRTVKRSAALAVMAALAATAIFAFAAGTAGASSKVQILRLSAKPGKLMFNTKTLHAHTGTVEIILDNPNNSGIEHGIGVTGHGVSKVGPVVQPGHDSTVTVKLSKKGSYTFFCPVPGHEAGGMKGTLTVS